MTKPLVLGVFQHLIPSGITYGSWRHPDSRAVDYLDLEHWTSLAVMLERAGLDFLFFADAYSYPVVGDRPVDVALRDAVSFPQADPVVLASAIAAATHRLGIVVTCSTTVERPQAVARRFATLDNLAKGRVGWNIVTGSGQATSARLFGEDMIPHDERYLVAEDHVQLALKLWEGSWEDDALVRDKAAGVYADPDKIHEIEHKGPYFAAHGLLTVPPSPQRAPLLVQAGTSRAGREFAAKYAEAVFLGGGEPEQIAASIAAIRQAAVDQGRGPDSIRFLVGASVIAAPTTAQARAKHEEMLTFATFESAAAAYANFTGIDVFSLDLDAPLGGVRTEQGQSSVERFTGADGRPAPTVREIVEEYRRHGVNGTMFVGDPVSIVDEIEEFVRLTGADGFLVQPHVVPGTYGDLIDLVLPELRRRGLARAEPEGETLREHVFGAGRRHLPDDHPGAALRAGR